MGVVQKGRLLLPAALLLLFSGCATLEVTQRQTLEPAIEKQPVILGIKATGDGRQVVHDTSKNPVIIGTDVASESLLDAIDITEDSIVKASSGKLFEKVLLLPKESETMQLKEIRSAYGADYMLSVVIGDVTVKHALNPLWFASLPMVFFKMYAPIVTFQPEVSLNVTLIDTASGATLMEKKLLETSSDHFAPKNPRPKVRKLISRTINNAMVSIMREAQQSVAVARQEKK